MSSPPPPTELLGDPIPSPRQTPQSLSGGLFFSGQDNATTLLEPGEGLPSQQQLDEELAAWDSGSGSSDGSLSESLGDPTSSPSAPAGDTSPLTKRAAKETARAAVRTAGVMAHRTLANTSGKVQAALYLTDDEDERGIGDPLGNLAHRHAGKLGGAVTEDTADLMQAFFGVTSYFAKQMNNIAAARRIDAGGQLQQVPDEQPAGF